MTEILRAAGFEIEEVRQLRTGLSRADSFRPDAPAWFDRQMRAPEECEEFAELCARMTRRYK